MTSFELFGWEVLAMTAAFIGVIGALILYMLSRAFNLPQLEQTAKSELIFAASTVFLVVAIVLLINYSEPLLSRVGVAMYAASFGITNETVIAQMTTSPSLSGTDPAAAQSYTLIDITKLYMDPVITCGRGMLKTLYLMSIPIESASTVFMEIFMSEHASGFGLKWMSERIKNTTEILTFYTFIYYFIVHILYFVKEYWALFLTIGIVCRSFPLTRGAGAYIMAISLGLYFVFPFSYILVGSVISAFTKSEYYNAETPIASLCLNPKMLGKIELCGQKASFSDVVEAQMQIDANKENIYDFFELMTPKILLHFTAVICLIPVIVMMLTLSFVLSGTSLFGGAIPEVGRGLMRFL